MRPASLLLPTSEGKLEGDSIVCPYHFSRLLWWMDLSWWQRMKPRLQLR